MTDSEGYTISLQYDAAGRVTRTTYPDGTYDQITYDRLDAKSVRDRLGRTTQYTYNANQQFVAVRDPLGRLTSFDRCGCGALDGIVDAKGQRTGYTRDLENRVTTETRPDNSTVQYQYEKRRPRV